MTVFCPSCGKPNTDEATNCAACGIELKKGAGGKKFKGTMMMQQPTGLGAKPTPGASPSVPPTGGAPGRPPSQPFPTAGQPPQGPASNPPGGRNLAFQKTMMGPMVVPGQTPSGPAPAGGPTSGSPAGRPPSQPFPTTGGGTPGAPGGAAPTAGGGRGSTIGTAPTMAASTGGFGRPASPSAVADDLPPAGGARPFSPSASIGSAPGAPPPSSGGFAQPPGSFGQPPNQGGFARPPGGGGGGGFGGPPPSDDAAKAKKKKLLFIALGCVGLIVVACIGTCVWAIFKGKSEMEKAQSRLGQSGEMDPMMANLARLPLTVLLSEVVSSCRTDPTGASIGRVFHPQTFEGAKATLCTTSSDALDAVSDQGRTQVAALASTNESGRATALQYDPNACFLFTADHGRVITCRDGNNATQIILYEWGASEVPAVAPAAPAAPQ